MTMQLTRWFDNFRQLRRPEHRTAWSIALAADALQIAVFPLFAAGGVSPADTGLDLIVAFMLTKLLGWHWAFLPTLGAELLPGLDLFPTWTAAVWFVTRNEGVVDEYVNETPQSNTKPGEPEILPPIGARR